MAGIQDLVDQVAQETQLSKVQSRSAVDALLASITEALARGEEVRLPGFGIFHVRQRAARMGRNVRTGEPLAIAASQRPAFSPGSRLVEQMKGTTPRQSSGSKGKDNTSREQRTTSRPASIRASQKRKTV